ncbi:MAG: hypothetical protein Aurels2KO_15800 [Aureliella sp.]
MLRLRLFRWPNALEMVIGLSEGSAVTRRARVMHRGGKVLEVVEVHAKTVIASKE